LKEAADVLVLPKLKFNIFMKLRLLYALAVVLVLASCKDDKESPTFKKENIIGTWLRTSTTIPADATCTEEELNIAETIFTQSCDGSIYYNYTYASNTISFHNEDFDVDYQVVVTSLDATTMKVDWKLEGQKFGSSTYAKQ
jgi:hypothetical protein